MISLEVTFMQPCLEVNAASGVQHSSTVYVEFANWFKVDKGDKGDTPDTSNLQTKTDNALQTSDKTIVGAINEINNKLPNTLPVTITGTAAAPIFTFTKANFDLVAQSYANGSQIFVDITDNRTATNKPIDLSYRYDAAWNKTLSQIEIPDPNIARGFYINGVTPANRGCVTFNTSKFATRDSMFKFNTTTGYYEYFDLIDITETEAITMYDDTSILGQVSTDMAKSCFNTRARMNFRPLNTWNGTKSFIGLSLYGVGQFGIRYLRLDAISSYPSGAGDVYLLIPNNLNNYSFNSYYCLLKKIYGNIEVGSLTGTITFMYNNNTLEQIYLYKLKANVNASYLQALNLDSISYWITNASNTNAITITLHSDAFARVTPEIFELATSKQISILSA